MSDFDIVLISLFACQHQHQAPLREFLFVDCAEAQCDMPCSRCEGLAALERIKQHIYDMESDRDVFDLRAENERLRNALRRIKKGYYDPAPPWAMAEAYHMRRLRRKQMMELAAAALKEASDGE